MRKPFTLRAEEKMIDYIKVESINKGFRNYADYIEYLLLQSLSIETMKDCKREDSSYSLIDDKNISTIEILIDNFKNMFLID